MADKLKPGQAGKGFADKLPEVRRRITEVNKHKEAAAEKNGAAGSATKAACENLNLNKAAFTFIASAKRKEPAEAMDRVLTLFALALGTGILDQIDMFDDRVQFIRAELEKRVEGADRPPAPGLANVAALAGVQ